MTEEQNKGPGSGADPDSTAELHINLLDTQKIAEAKRSVLNWYRMYFHVYEPVRAPLQVLLHRVSVIGFSLVMC